VGGLNDSLFSNLAQRRGVYQGKERNTGERTRILWFLDPSGERRGSVRHGERFRVREEQGSREPGGLGAGDCEGKAKFKNTATVKKFSRHGGIKLGARLGLVNEGDRRKIVTGGEIKKKLETQLVKCGKPVERGLGGAYCAGKRSEGASNRERRIESRARCCYLEGFGKSGGGVAKKLLKKKNPQENPLGRGRL